MKSAKLFATSALMVIAIEPVLAQKAARAYATGYLAGSAVPDMIRVLPTAPSVGSPRDSADRAIFHATRSLQDSPRWGLAQRDDDLSVPGVLAAFSCTLEVTLNRSNAPHTTALLERVSSDTNATTSPAKQHFLRKRPFLVDDGPVCVAQPPHTPDFPSSHSTIGWAASLIFAEILPERSTEIMTRGRAYGESRVVCGVHNASAVEAGRVAGAALVAALHGSEAFRADLKAVQIEIADLRKHPHKKASAEPAGCAAEAALIATTPY